MHDAGGSDAAEARLNRLLNLILETAVDVLGFDAATATARHDQDVSTLAATDQRFIAMDDAQYEAGEGPCLAVLEPHDPVEWSAGDPEQLWQSFREAAERIGVRSSLSVHVPTDDVSAVVASLNLYARSQRSATAAQITRAEAFAAQLAVAMQSIEAARATANLASGLAEAMRSRAVIEQAKGMLMSEKLIDADQAFALLTTMSQTSNVKLREVAARLVDARVRGEPG